MDGLSLTVPVAEQRGDSAVALIAENTFHEYASALSRMASRVDASFEAAVQAILASRGRVIISGMGKSGLIGKKIAATFASTGTPSFFMHPAEAIHGDLGMITPDDLVILISYSGETDEITALLPTLQHFGVQRIALVGRLDSTLARNCQIVLDVSVQREVCPNNLAPTTSTLATLAMGDALAVALIEQRNFQPLDFARYHPGGSLGRRLLTRVKDVMHTHNLPIIALNDPMQHAIFAMTYGRLGIAIVMDGDRLAGIITDGDLRRWLMSHDALMDTPASAVMTFDPLTAHEDEMLSEAEARMVATKTSSLIVLNTAGQVTGVVQIYDK